jgi:hypothetical protein
MSKKPLTPEQVQANKLREIRRLFNRAKGMYSLGHIKTYGEVLRELGLTEWEGVESGKEVLSLKELAPIFQQIEDWVISKQGEPAPVKEPPPIPKDQLSAKKRELISRYKTSDNQLASLYEHQKYASVDIFDRMFGPSGVRAIALSAATGTGKTFIIGQVLRWALDNGYPDKHSMSPFPIVYVTKASIVEQTERVLRNQFGINTISEVVVTNYDQFRSRFGETFLKKETYVEQGIEYTKYVWKKFIHPIILVLDEFQSTKNKDSTQSTIFQEFNELDDPNIKVICASATLFTRVIEAQVFVAATKIPWSNGISSLPITNRNFHEFAKWIADPALPEEYSPSAVNRLMHYMDDYVVYVKNVRSKFHAKNGVELIEFDNDRDKAYYEEAWDRFMEEKSKIEANPSISNSKFLIAVQMLKFSQAAEFVRTPYLAREMYWDVVRDGKASVAAVKYQPTIAKIVMHLTQDYNVPRDQISLIWGGSAGFNSGAEKYTDAEIKEILKLTALGEKEYPKKVIKEILAQLSAKAAGLGEIPEGLRLGPQSRAARQAEIDRFQSGKALYNIFTFKAGGIGLSLHHTDEMTEFKCRKTEAGWPIDEDIPRVPTRPRRTRLAPVYSAIELVQGLGRAPRLTSLSDTIQTMVFYAGTIEEEIAAKVSVKLKCLREVVRAKESWEDIILGYKEDAIWTTEEDSEESPTDNMDMFDEESEKE